MKGFTNALLLLLFVMAAGLVHSTIDTLPTPADYIPACEADNTTFQPGEELTYTLYYHLKPFWLRAGEVTFVVSDQGDTYHVEVTGETVSTFEWFYKVHDVYTCDMDKETLKPVRSTRDIKEGKYRKYTEAVYDFDNQQVLARTGKHKEDLKEIKTAMDDCMHDVLSIIYYARNVDYDQINIGTNIPANIYMDDDKYNLGFKFLGREKEKKIKKLGKYDTILLQPTVVDGHVFDEGTEMKVYASDDANRVPLLIESPVSVGSVKAVLKSHKNLMTPLVAR